MSLAYQLVLIDPGKFGPLISARINQVSDLGTVVER